MTIYGIPGLSEPETPLYHYSGHECAEVTNITAHAHRGFFSLTVLLRKKFYFLSPLQRVDSLGCFENTDFTQLGFIDNLESKGEKPAEHTVGLQN